jgi:hypothetical protein
MENENHMIGQTLAPGYTRGEITYTRDEIRYTRGEINIS